MGFWSELGSRLSLYYGFTRKEVRDILICVFFTAFIFSFNDWGRAGQFSLVSGLRNFFLVFFLAILAYFVHLSAQRIFALSIGFKAEFKLWWGGLITSLLVVFITASLFGLGFTVILPGGIVIALLTRHRLGEFRYGVNYWESGITALWGPVASILFAFVFKIFLIFFPQSWFLQKGLLINLIYGICSMLPLPNLDGINVFFSGRVFYAFVYGLMLGVALLIYWANLWLTIIGAIIIGIAIWLLFYFFVEPK